MKIYFAGSIRGGRDDVKLYAMIIKHLGKYGKVLTEHVADKNIEAVGERNMSDQEIHDRDLDWLTQSDVVVAEVTAPSLGVGYEIRSAVEQKKKVLCLYRPQEDKRLSAMINGCKEVNVESYLQLNDAIEIIDRFFLNYQLSTR